MLRYGLAYLFLLLVVPPAGWLMLQMLSDLSFTWRVMGGSGRLHWVGYNLLASLIVVVWVSGFIIAESWFRRSIDEIRIRRARAEIGSPMEIEAPKNRVMAFLQELGLEVLSRRVFIALGLLVFLVVLRVLCQQLLFSLAYRAMQ